MGIGILEISGHYCFNGGGKVEYGGIKITEKIDRTNFEMDEK